MNGMLKDLGAYPAPGPESREKKEFYKLTEEDSIWMISGDRTPALMSVWASNDKVQFGTLKLVSGGSEGPVQTEYDAHPGTAVFYVLEGTATFLIKDRKETYDVAKGDFMFIPQNECYKIINYDGSSTKLIFAVAPEF